MKAYLLTALSSLAAFSPAVATASLSGADPCSPTIEYDYFNFDWRRDTNVLKFDLLSWNWLPGCESSYDARLEGAYDYDTGEASATLWYGSTGYDSGYTRSTKYNVSIPGPNPAFVMFGGGGISSTYGQFFMTLTPFPGDFVSDVYPDGLFFQSYGWLDDDEVPHFDYGDWYDYYPDGSYELAGLGGFAWGKTTPLQRVQEPPVYRDVPAPVPLPPAAGLLAGGLFLLGGLRHRL